MKFALGAVAAAVFAAGVVLATSALSQTPQTAPAGAPAPGAPVPGRGGPGGPGGAGGAGRGPNPAIAQGQAAFNAKCKGCHDPAVDRAPNLAALSAFWPNDVINILKTGAMQPMAAGMSDSDISAVAYFLTGQAPTAPFDFGKEASNPCPASNKFSAAGPSWNGWSPDPQNSRQAVGSAFTAASAPAMKVKWAFAYQGGRYGEPTPFGNRVFVTSSSGHAYALDKKTGCVAWTFTKQTSIRMTPSVGRNARAPSGYAVYIGDNTRSVTALDANSGHVLWTVHFEDHPRAVLTGGGVLYNGILYVPLSSGEETVASLNNYECCKARGAVIAIDTAKGTVKWKSRTLPVEPAPTKKNSAGTQMYGPAGAAVWSTPTVDPKRHLIYVATGDSYTDVKEPYFDAVEAMDMATGEIKWVKQVEENDNFLTGCFSGGGPARGPAAAGAAPPAAPAPARAGPANCPSPAGPDHDFGSSPILVHMTNGKDVILAGQKSGAVYAMDPDNKGNIIWQTRIGLGGALGGVEWGMAADRNNLYVAVNQGQPGPGGPAHSLTALRLTDGVQQWQHVAPEPAKCSFAGRCSNGYSAPPTLSNGVLFGPNQDGHIRAFTAADGHQILDFDTAGQKYDTVNGVMAQHGGNLDATGLTIAGDMAFIMAGYNGSSGSSGPDNVLLAFSVDAKPAAAPAKHRRKPAH